MAVIYGWTYAQFHANVGWQKGAATEYDFWENYWSIQANSYIFQAAGVLLTDADEIVEMQTLINKMMVLMNLYLKGDSNETPMQSGFYGIGFPGFVGDPDENDGKGSGDYIMLNKYKRIYGEEHARADQIRMGINPSEMIYFGRERMY